MATCFITGPPGVGKTTLLAELSSRGYATLDADSTPGLCGWIDESTGLKVADWSPEQSTAPEGCRWGWDTPRMHEIAAHPTSDPFFFGGNTHGTARFYALFDKVVALIIDDDELIKRLTSPRDNPNNYGQKPEHIIEALATNHGFAERAQAHGAIVIDAAQPVARIADRVIEAAT
jgi:adenylate kinase family enzyme